MKNKNLFLLTVLLTLTACQNGNNSEIDYYLKDTLNREVGIPKQIDKVVCIGAGALRLYSYVGDLELLSGIEDVDKSSSNVGQGLPLRPYQMINEEYFNSLPSCGTGGPQSQVADGERILMCNPDIVISALPDAKANDMLSKQINRPVFAISYGKTEAFDEIIKTSIELLGKIFNKQDRSNELVDCINGIQFELNELTKDIEDDEKPSLYIGCQSNFGVHGIESSSAQYPIFDVSNIKNVLDINGYHGYQKNIDLEALLAMDPDKIIIDAGGLNILKQQYQLDEKAEIFNAMSAFKNQEVYLQMPYNGYFTNLEIAYCDAYYAASVSYPDLFKNFDIETKSAEIFIKFLGDNCYPEVAKEMFGGFQKINLKEMFDKYE